MFRLVSTVLAVLALALSPVFPQGPAEKKRNAEAIHHGLEAHATTQGPAEKKGTAGKEFLFVGVGKCYKCHKGPKNGSQFEIWLKSPHAKAYETLGSEKAKNIARKRGLEGDPQKNPACLKCHSLRLGAAKGKTEKKANFSYVVGQDEEKKTVQSFGIECETCHGPGSAYKSKKIMKDRKTAMENGLQDAKKRCVVCHDPKNESKFDFKKAFRKIAHPKKAKPADSGKKPPDSEKMNEDDPGKNTESPKKVSGD